MQGPWKSALHFEHVTVSVSASQRRTAATCARRASSMEVVWPSGGGPARTRRTRRAGRTQTHMRPGSSFMASRSTTLKYSAVYRK